MQHNRGYNTISGSTPSRLLSNDRHRYQDKSVNDYALQLEAMFRIIFPCPTHSIPFFNDDNINHTTADAIILEQYEQFIQAFVTETVQALNQQVPGNLTDYRLLENTHDPHFRPYERQDYYPHKNTSFFLDDGKKRWEYVQSILPVWEVDQSFGDKVGIRAGKYKFNFIQLWFYLNPSSGWWNGRWYTPEFTQLYPKVVAAMNSLPTTKWNNKNWSEANVSGYFDNEFWGKRGIFHYQEPPEWKQFDLYDNSLMTNYDGAFVRNVDEKMMVGLAPPILMMMFDSTLFSSTPDPSSMDYPGDNILNWWHSVLFEFKKKNPNMFVFADPIGSAHALLPGDYGGKVNIRDPIAASKAKFNQNKGLLEWDGQFHVMRDSLYDYLEKNWKYAFYRYGLHRRLAVPELQSWFDSVVQSLHILLAHRHHYAPWNLYNSSPVSNLKNGDALGAAFEKLKLKWDIAVWSDVTIGNPFFDNFLPPGQEPLLPNAKKKKNPSSFLYTNHYISWRLATEILADINTSWVDKKPYIMRPDHVSPFANWVWHWNFKEYKEIFDYFDNSLHQQIARATNPSNLNANGWIEFLQYFALDFAHFVANSKSPIIRDGCDDLRKFIKNPDNPEPVPDDGHHWGPHHEPNELEVEMQFWGWMKAQWMATKDFQDWPEIHIDYQNQTYSIYIKQQQPPFLKWFNTFFKQVFDPAPPTPNFFPGYNPDQGNAVQVIKGFFLPPNKEFGPKIQRYYFWLQTNIIPIIMTTPLLPDTFQSRLEDQWQAYKDWIIKNIEMEDAYYSTVASYKAQNKTIDFSIPAVGDKLVDVNGNYLFEYLVNGDTSPDNKVYLRNQYPNLGVFARYDDEKTSYSWVFSPGSWAKYLFGNEDGMIQNVINFVSMVTKKIFNLLSDTVTFIINKAADVVHNVLPSATYLAAVAIGILFVYKYIDNKTKKM